jgi:hypothetical protein
MVVLEATGDIRKVSLGAFNLSLIVRKRLGAGTPGELKKPGRGARFTAFLVAHMPVSPPSSWTTENWPRHGNSERKPL